MRLAEPLPGRRFVTSATVDQEMDLFMSATSGL